MGFRRPVRSESAPATGHDTIVPAVMRLVTSPASVWESASAFTRYAGRKVTKLK